jgi:hypothetical protein
MNVIAFIAISPVQPKLVWLYNGLPSKRRLGVAIYVKTRSRIIVSKYDEQVR